MTEEIKATRGPRQVKVGTVVCNKMNKTVVVAVEKPVVHRLYHRFQKRTTKFHAHDEEQPVRDRRSGGDRLHAAAVEDQALARASDPEAGRGELEP